MVVALISREQTGSETSILSLSLHLKQVKCLKQLMNFLLKGLGGGRIVHSVAAKAILRMNVEEYDDANDRMI